MPTNPLARCTRGTAFHEAGHVVAAHIYGHGIHKCRVAAGPATFIYLHDRRVVSQGICEAVHIYSIGDMACTPPQFLPYVRESALRLAIVCMAGPYAHARVGHRHVTDILSRCGGNDQNSIEAILADAELSDQLDWVYRCTRDLVRSHWPLIGAVAERLMRDGAIERGDLLFEGMPRRQPLPPAQGANARDRDGVGRADGDDNQPSRTDTGHR